MDVRVRTYYDDFAACTASASIHTFECWNNGEAPNVNVTLLFEFEWEKRAARQQRQRNRQRFIYIMTCVRAVYMYTVHCTGHVAFEFNNNNIWMQWGHSLATSRAHPSSNKLTFHLNYMDTGHSASHTIPRIHHYHHQAPNDSEWSDKYICDVNCWCWHIIIDSRFWWRMPPSLARTHSLTHTSADGAATAALIRNVRLRRHLLSCCARRCCTKFTFRHLARGGGKIARQTMYE